jgi:glycosyltransferase involved in cell wall biosynthesis
MDSKRLSVIHNGVNISRLDAVENHTTNADGIRLLSVGRLVPVKCHKTLFRSFASLIEEFPEASLILVGAGPLREELHTVARELGIIDDVHFTGQISRERVYAEFAKTDVFVLTSRAEGFCVAAVEAMAAGLPVVVSDIEVLHEVVGDPGVFADPNSPEDFADAISDLLQQPERRERLGQEAKERARSKFSLERTAQGYFNLYKQEAETLKQ